MSRVPLRRSTLVTSPGGRFAQRVMAVGLCLAATAGALAGNPVKLVVAASGDRIRVDGSATLTVTVLDADNRPATATRAMPVTVTARMPDGSQVRRELTIPAGQGSGNLTLSLPQQGLVDVRASQPELLEGGTFLKVRTGGRTVAPDTAAPPPVLRPQPNARLSALPAPVVAPATTNLRANLAAPLARAAAPAIAATPKLTLRYSPQGRALLADGKDGAVISAFVMDDEPAGQAIQIRLFNSQGVLDPNATLVIPPGQDSGEVRLTSTQAGVAEVEYMGANLAARLEGERKLAIPFAPPVSLLTLRASPPDITLMEQADLVVQLSDASGRPVAGDTARTVTLTLDGGRGILGAKEILIPAGGSAGRASFVPTGLGVAQLSAYSPGLLKSTCDIRVGMPFLLIGASICGALAGGVLAYFADRPRNRWRILIGLITGFLLYLAAAFLDIMPTFSLGAFHPFAVLLVSALGGWLGTKIFDPLVKRLGLSG